MSLIKNFISSDHVDEIAFVQQLEDVHFEDEVIQKMYRILKGRCIGLVILNK